jgi:hypothetical protein
LFAVHSSQKSVEANGYPFIAHFPNVSDMVHLDLFSYFATGHPQFRAGPQPDEGSYNIHVVLVSHLEGQFVFCPVLVLIEADLTVWLPSSTLDENREFLSKAFEDLGDRNLVFLRQRLCQREFQDILDARALFPVIYKAVVVLKTTVHATVELDNLIGIQGSP